MTRPNSSHTGKRRKNRSRGNHTPAELLAQRAPHLSPKILLLPPVLLDAQVGQDLSGPPAVRVGSCRVVSGRVGSVSGPRNLADRL